MKTMARLISLLLATCVALGVDAAPRRRAVAPRPGPAVISLSFDFAAGDGLGWEADFADYNPVTDMRTTAGVRQLPIEAGIGKAWYLSGWNYSDDLFMYLRRQVTPADGIVPGTSYLAEFRVTFATNAGDDCVGIGGAPGTSVYLKMGLAPTKPLPVLVGDHLRLNIDKGNQSQSGVHASQAGTIAAQQPTPCSAEAPFSTVVRRHSHPLAVPASPTGELWLLFGTDSGFEGYTQIYVQRIEVTLTPVPSDDQSARWQTTYATVDAIVTDLRRNGHVLRDGGASTFSQIGGRDVHYAMGTPGVLEEIHFYVFDTSAEAERAAASISADGRMVGNDMVTWIAPPHFFRGDHLIIGYLGSDRAVISLLERSLGRQFSGAP